MHRVVTIVVLAAALSACAAYHVEPLPEAPVLAAAPSSTPMTIGDVGHYAIDHSPNLIAEKRKTEVTTAQAYEGGLLPDPQFSASADHPTVHGPGLVNGYALGLAQDLQALLTEPSRKDAAEAKEKQAKLDLLWAEWQTLQNSSSLYVQKVYGDPKAAALQRTAEILQQQSGRSEHELQRHNTTIDVAGADLSTALDVESQFDSAARAAVAADANLKALLGLAPTASLMLVDPGEPPELSQEQVDEALQLVTRRRPDLLALQAGYHAQEENVRTAILQQFPAITMDFNRASDTSNIQTNGMGLTINIPIFGSTQARIRTERATRSQLRAEYQARLDQTTADAWRLWRGLLLLRQQVDRLGGTVPKLRKMADISQKAYAAGNLAPATYAVLVTSLSAREGELLDLKMALWEDTIALRTLLALTPLIPETSMLNNETAGPKSAGKGSNQ